MAPVQRSPGGRNSGNRGCTEFLAGLMNSRRSRDKAATLTPSRPVVERITAGTRAFLSAWKATTCAPASSSNRRTTSNLRAESFSTSRTGPAEIDGPSRSLQQTCCALPAALDYQILHACSRTIDSPFLQPKAFANSAIFESGPLPRNLGSGCGLVLAINRAYSIRSLAPQTCAQPRKKRCSGVKPSLSGGRFLPARDFSYAA